MPPTRPQTRSETRPSSQLGTNENPFRRISLLPRDNSPPRGVAEEPGNPESLVTAPPLQQRNSSFGLDTLQAARSNHSPLVTLARNENQMSTTYQDIIEERDERCTILLLNQVVSI